MNLLIDKLPTDYEGLKIDTNFRSFILFELLMQDSSLKKEEKIFLIYSTAVLPIRRKNTKHYSHFKRPMPLL